MFKQRQSDLSDPNFNGADGSQRNAVDSCNYQYSSTFCRDALVAPMGRLPANLPTNVTSPLKSPKRLKPDIHHVIFGDLLFQTWYPSFYPDAFIGTALDRLYVCQWCFKYTKEEPLHLSHLVCLEPIGSRYLFADFHLTENMQCQDRRLAWPICI